ncbi:hypothetical protein DB35_15950 [Streptomyces abyssalis]|nr:hypothetical protein DB35_15950 [Streptomyces abyssalis]
MKEATEGQRQEVSEVRSGQMRALVETWQRNNGNWAADQPSGYDYEDLQNRIVDGANNAHEDAKRAEGKK